MKIVVPLMTLFIISCGLFGSATAKKETQYLLIYNGKSYVFEVTDIRRERTEKTLLESIVYKLYPEGMENSETLTSFIKYKNIKKSEHSYELERIEGTTEISNDVLSFTWSYGSDNHVYLYLEEGTKLKKV
jgi:hypothetical protein